MNNEDEKTIKQKVDFYFKEQVIIHIRFKKGFWKRGIIEEVSADFFILNETLEGRQPVFFQEISSLDKWRKA